MKYKDFKQMSNAEMKSILGGFQEPGGGGTNCGTCYGGDNSPSTYNCKDVEFIGCVKSSSCSSASNCTVA